MHEQKLKENDVADIDPRLLYSKFSLRLTCLYLFLYPVSFLNWLPKIALENEFEL